MANGKRSGAHTLLTIVMDVLVAVAVMALAHLVVGFFGSAANSGWGAGVLRVTGLFVIPLGIAPIHTPYAGVFEVDAAATILVLLAAEWVLGLVRRSA